MVERLLGEPHPQAAQALELGLDVVDAERRERDAVLDQGRP